MHKKYGDSSDEESFGEMINEDMFFMDILEELEKVNLPQSARRQIQKNIGVLHWNSRDTLPGEVGSGGTGFLLSPDLVLTAAHNLFNKSVREMHQRIIFYPGHQGTFKKENEFEVEDFYLPGRFTIRPEPAIKQVGDGGVNASDAPAAFAVELFGHPVDASKLHCFSGPE